LQTDLVFFKKCEITQLGFATLCSTQSTNSCKRRNELRDYKHHNSNNAYSLSHKSLNTVPYTGSTFIVGAGPRWMPKGIHTVDLVPAHCFYLWERWRGTETSPYKWFM